MIRHQELLDAIERQLEARLRPPHVPDSYLIWQAISPRLSRRPTRGRRRGLLLRAAVALLAVIGLTTGLALASSPDLREYAAEVWSGRATMVGGKVTNSGLDSLYPAPHFSVLQPSSLPDGWAFVGYGYRPSDIEVGPVNLPRPDGVSIFSRLAGRDIPRDVVEQASSRTRRLLRGIDPPVLVLVYARDAQQLADVVERPAFGRALPAGEPSSVHGLPAVYTRQEVGRDSLVWIERATLLEVSATTGRADAVRIAETVQVTPLVQFEQTGGGQQMLNMPPPTPPVRLAQRVGGLEPARTTGAEIVARCGWPPTIDGRPTADAMQQLKCAARLAIGTPDDQGTDGFSLERWATAAERLGIDPSSGPADDPLVYLVQVGISEYHGSVMVLDAATAQPYAVARLQPAVSSSR